MAPFGPEHFDAITVQARKGAEQRIALAKEISGQAVPKALQEADQRTQLIEELTAAGVEEIPEGIKE